VDLPSVVDPVDVLAQPTRTRLFALLQEGKQPLGTQALAQSLGLHSNGVRMHLERMQTAGLITRARVTHGRGRPRDVWTIAPGARPGGEPPSAYADLVRWLARAIPPRPGRLRDVEATGRQVGRELAPDDGRPAADALQTALAALGFAPSAEISPGRKVTYCLGNCPYRDAVRENQEVICTLHKGMTRGLLDVLDPAARLTGFVPRDPDTAGCLIEVAGIGTSEQEDRPTVPCA
jgi:predicted ArsR family transcriptional regulator